MATSRFLNAEEARARFGALADTYAASLERGDPIADATVEALHGLGHGRWWETVLAGLEQGVGAVENCPPEVATCAALMIDYWSPAFSKPLVLTGSLLDDTGHRLARTGAWWEQVHRPDGSRQSQDGFKTTVHVRLVHAWVRRMALKSGHWDSKAWGQLINQGDLLFQAVGFTWLTLRSLERMGYRLKAGEQAAYYRLWRYLGAALGIDAELVSLLNEEDCARLWDLWLLTNPLPDENSVKLAQATLRSTAATLGSGWARDHVYYPMLCGTARWLMGDKVGDGLQIPKTYWSTLLPLTYAPAVKTSEFFETVVPYERPRAVARAARRAVTENRVTSVLSKGTDVVAEPERLANLTEFAPVSAPTQSASDSGTAP